MYVPTTPPFLARAARALWLLLLLALLPAGGGASRMRERKGGAVKSAWTLMIYQDADNTLETPSIANLKEMLQVGSTDRVQVIVLCDRSPKSEPKDQYTDEAVGGLPDWAGTRLLRVQQGRLQSVADWGHANMGDPQTLRRFVETTAALYPAEHYGLILEDHGSGWSSLCVDETSGDKALTLRDLRAALLPFAQTYGRFDLVGIDACLMASVETAQAVAPVAHLLVASEELAPARGWNYDAFLKALTARPDMDALALARSIVDLYTIHFNQDKERDGGASSMAATLSVLDLDRLGLLQDALTTLADRSAMALHGGHAQWVQVAQARARAEEYGVSGEGSESNEEMRDVIDLAQHLSHADAPGLADAAQRVEACAKKVVRYGMRGPCRPHSSGISVYFPIKGIRIAEPGGAAYLRDTFARESRWADFLALYGAYIKAFHHKPHLQPFSVAERAASEEQPVELLSQASDDDIDRAYFVMAIPAGADLLLIGRIPTPLLGNGVMGHRFNGHWFRLHTRDAAMTCPLTDTTPLNEQYTRYLAEVSAQIKQPGSPKWMDVSFTFEVTVAPPAPQCRMLYAFALTPEGPLQIALKPGSMVRPVYTRITAAGDVDVWAPPDNGSYLLIEDPRQFGLEWGKIKPGPYQVGFEVVNLAGEGALQLAKLALK